MEECLVCLTPETKAVLFEVVSPKGIVKVCGRCYGSENFPLVKKSSPFHEQREQSVHERMMKISGISQRMPEIKYGLAPEDASLKRIADINTIHDLVDFNTNPEAKKEFAYNFHWIMMRGRRSKHVTQEQLAKAIHEPERMIRMIEKGSIPKNRNIITKIENYLGINLRKTGRNPEAHSYPKIIQGDAMDVTGSEDKKDSVSRNLKIDEEGYVVLKDSSDITLADLREVEKRKKQRGF